VRVPIDPPDDLVAVERLKVFRQPASDPLPLNCAVPPRPREIKVVLAHLLLAGAIIWIITSSADNGADGRAVRVTRPGEGPVSAAATGSGVNLS
jgi:hypothetical protein